MCPFGKLNFNVVQGLPILHFDHWPVLRDLLCCLALIVTEEQLQFAQPDT